VSGPALEIAGLAVRFGGATALEDVELSVGPGEFVVVLGPTGAGKTTLLRTIAGLERPHAGTIRLHGRDAVDLEPADRDVALVFQNFSLYPSRTVRENLAFPLRAPGRRMSRAAIAERVGWAAKLLKIEALLDRPSRRLSGGEMQRVAIGRAIVRRPKLFLMDEPLSNLDAKLREELRVELRELARSLATPVLWVTHDQAEATAMADRVAVLEAGRILQVAPPEDVYSAPISPRVARLLGTPPMNLIRCFRDGGWWRAEDGTRVVECGPGGKPGEDAARATIGVRPEHVATEGGASEGEIELVEELGPVRVVVVRWAGARFHVLASRSPPFAVGQRIRPRIDPARAIAWSAQAGD
jgi:multiple sugar transport system ATP-binding protein